MCGICGIASLDGEGAVEKEAIQRMTLVQRHRGPDDEGMFFAPGIGLGFRRLAILDLSSAGHQPMSNEDETLWLTFNGEIYNFRDLVPLLERCGHCFHSRADSEVILHAYEQWGTACLRHLNGMFAFALWDSQRRSLLLARDRLGVKPLYYWSDGRRFAWSSELKALLTLPWLARRLNLHALQTYLRCEYIPAPDSIFEGIRKLPAGHLLEIPLDGSAMGRLSDDWQASQYWDVRFGVPEQADRRTVDDYAEELRCLVKAAVARRLVSDVPLGVFLSGGLDSSTIVALMREVSTECPKTFSIGFAEKTFDESDYAALVARHFETDHHVAILNPDVRELVQTVADALDEPFADASALPTYLVSRVARQFVTVALGGDGGDELFAGYDWYRAQRVAASSLDLLPAGVRSWPGALAASVPPASQKKGLRNIARRFLAAADLPPALQHLRWQLFWREQELAQLLCEPPDAGADRVLLALLAAGGDLPLDQQQYSDIKRYLPDDILFKVDRMSMAVSLEVRGPLLDYTVVEFAARLPVSLRLRGLTGKYLLRRAMRGILPAPVLSRSKLGFNIPYKNWLRGELRPLLLEALAPERLARQGLFQPAAVQRLIGEHLQGVRDHAHKLWQLLMFQLWAERYLAGTLPARLHTVEHVQEERIR
ncbi:MAG: asparagine synthase (glutamine-hydrolyzing) [Ktedonobacteraceae bacterium]|nr:asparagine synthase (glutamine-hydrolyzing) [Ktedonobacteraceae bacterium]